LFVTVRIAEEKTMNKRISSVCVTLGLGCSFAAISQSQEKHLKKSDLPAPVQKTADEQTEGTVRGYSKEGKDGKLMYEVQLTVDGHSKDVGIDATGNVVEVEEQVALEKLSPEIRKRLQNKAATGKITNVESITKHGTVVAYEAQVLTGGKKTKVQVGPEGQPLDHEE
jgi:hypothetical protein